MVEKPIEETKKVLADDMESYVKIILEEYQRFIPPKKIESLQNISQFEDKIIIENSGTISMFANSDGVSMPLGAYQIFKVMRRIPGYGVNKKHRKFKDGEILNNNTYYDYIKHAFISGMNTEEFYRESLLHEVMHFCGAGGNDLLSEGFTELKTRELAQKHGLRTTRSAYPKEVKIASKIQEMFGTEISDYITFAETPREIEKLIVEKYGEKTMHLFFEIEKMMNKASKKVYDHSKFGGLLGPIKKAKAYAKVDYSGIDKKLIDMKNAIGESRNRKISFLSEDYNTKSHSIQISRPNISAQKESSGFTYKKHEEDERTL